MRAFFKGLDFSGEFDTADAMLRLRYTTSSDLSADDSAIVADFVEGERVWRASEVVERRATYLDD